MSKKKIQQHYEPRLRTQRENYDILDWASRESQEARFVVLASCVGLSGKSLLDIGCGLGDLYGFLKAEGIDADYTGVDILESMVEEARRRHPEGEFLSADLFSLSPFEPESFDVTFCSGALNLNLGNNDAFLPKAAKAMLDHAREAAVINLLHRRIPIFDRRYWAFDPGDVRKWLAHLPAKVQIVEDYLPNDFTVILRKPH